MTFEVRKYHTLFRFGKKSGNAGSFKVFSRRHGDINRIFSGISIGDDHRQTVKSVVGGQFAVIIAIGTAAPVENVGFGVTEFTAPAFEQIDRTEIAILGNISAIALSQARASVR